MRHKEESTFGYWLAPDIHGDNKGNMSIPPTPCLSNVTDGLQNVGPKRRLDTPKSLLPYQEREFLTYDPCVVPLFDQDDPFSSVRRISPIVSETSNFLLVSYGLRVPSLA